MAVDLSSEYLKALQNMQSVYSTNATSTSVQNLASQDTESDKDSYVSKMKSSEEAMPSETYNNIMEIIKQNKMAAGESPSAPTDADFEEALAAYNTESTDASTTTAATGTESGLGDAADDAGNAQSASSASSSSQSSSTSQTQTTTEIVPGPNGALYEKTTTTSSDGTETVSMTLLSAGQMAGQSNKTGDISDLLNSLIQNGTSAQNKQVSES